MTQATDTYIHAMRDAGIKVVDVRGKLPTAAPRSYGGRLASGIIGTTLHHLGTSAYKGRSGLSLWSQVAEGQMGKASKPPGIQYSAGVDGDGTLYIFWDIEVRVWAQGVQNSAAAVEDRDENRTHFALLVAGNFQGYGNDTGNQPTEMQLKTVRAHLGVTSALFDWTDNSGHRDHFKRGATQCPGELLANLAHVSLDVPTTAVTGSETAEDLYHRLGDLLQFS